MIDRFANLSLDLTIGEFDEMNHSFNLHQNRDQYLKRLRRKTASMFIVAASAGPLLGSAPEDVVEQLGDYGYNLGMAFQIIDDILDFNGSQEEIGKPVGNDLLQGIITLPIILALESNNYQSDIHELLKNFNDKSKLREVIKKIINTELINESFNIAKDYCDKAIDALNFLPSNESRDSLETLVNSLKTPIN